MLHGHTLELLEGALDVWPTAASKFSHMERHVAQAAQSVRPSALGPRPSAHRPHPRRARGGHRASGSEGGGCW